MATVINSQGVTSPFSTDHIVGTLVNAGLPVQAATNHAQVIATALDASGATRVSTDTLRTAVGQVVASSSGPDPAALGTLFRGSQPQAVVPQGAIPQATKVGGPGVGLPTGGQPGRVVQISATLPWRGYPAVPQPPTTPPPPPPDPVPNDPNLALVLSAGSSKVAFEVGAIRYLYSTYWPAKKQPLPGILVGTSGGSLNAVKLAEGGVRALDELEGIWLRMHHDWDMFLMQLWVKDLASIAPQLIRMYITSSRLQRNVILSILELALRHS